MTAVETGTDGNVEPNTITIVPRGEDPVALKVATTRRRRPAARTRSSRRSTRRTSTARSRRSTATLPDAFAAAIDGPVDGPGGATVFAETAVLGEPTPTVDPATLVGQEVETFELGSTATGTVVAVDAAPVEAIAEGAAARETSVGPRAGRRLDRHRGRRRPVANGQVVSFPVTAPDGQVAVLDPDELQGDDPRQAVEEAPADPRAVRRRRAHVWPDWVGSIPGMDSRVTA